MEALTSKLAGPTASRFRVFCAFAVAIPLVILFHPLDAFKEAHEWITDRWPYVRRSTLENVERINTEQYKLLAQRRQAEQDRGDEYKAKADQFRDMYANEKVFRKKLDQRRAKAVAEVKMLRRQLRSKS